MEIWKDVVDYEGMYQISNCGSVRSLDRISTHSPGHFKLIKGKKISSHDNGLGYLRVCLVRDGERKYHYVHRLVLSAFVLNTNNNPEANHKNGIKTDNRVENLEWCSSSNNKKHAYSIGLKKPKKGIDSHLYGIRGKLNKQSKKVNQICKSTGIIIKTWDSLHCPYRENNWDYRNIHLCVKGKRPTAYGFKWEYA